MYSIVHCKYVTSNFDDTDLKDIKESEKNC